MINRKSPSNYCIKAPTSSL